MRWVDSSRQEQQMEPRMAQMLLLKGKRPGSSAEERFLAARAATRLGDHAAIIELLEPVLREVRGEAGDWYALAQSYLAMRRFDEAIETAKRGDEAIGPYAPLVSVHAKALLRQGDEVEAEQQFMLAAELGLVEDAVYEMLRMTACRHDGAALLNSVEELEGRFGKSVITLANRAIAHSFLEDSEKAGDLIDLDRQVKRRSIRETMPEGEINAFHRQLVEEAHAAAPLADNNDILVEYRPNVAGLPAMKKLHDWGRSVFEDYIANLDVEREKAWFDPDFDTVSLFFAVTKLRNDASNGQHIHRQSLVSGVYHLLVDEELMQTQDDRGSLEVGNVDLYTRGHTPIWGRRLFKPEPGQFTLFPAHIFHDVVPTRSQALRISIPMDLWVMDTDEANTARKSAY